MSISGCQAVKIEHLQASAVQISVYLFGCYEMRTIARMCEYENIFFFTIQKLEDEIPFRGMHGSVYPGANLTSLTKSSSYAEISQVNLHPALTYDASGYNDISSIRTVLR